MAIPVIVLPLLTVAITIATHWLMLLFSSIVDFWQSGMKLAVALDTPAVVSDVDNAALPSSSRTWSLLCAVLRVDAAGFRLGASRSMFYGPFFRRWPSALSKRSRSTRLTLAKSSSHTSSGSGILVPLSSRANMAMHPLTLPNLIQFLSSPGLWIGLLIAVSIPRDCNPTARAIKLPSGTTRRPDYQAPHNGDNSSSLFS